MVPSNEHGPAETAARSLRWLPHAGHLTYGFLCRDAVAPALRGTPADRAALVHTVLFTWACEGMFGCTTDPQGFHSPERGVAARQLVELTIDPGLAPHLPPHFFVDAAYAFTWLNYWSMQTSEAARLATLLLDYARGHGVPDVASLAQQVDAGGTGLLLPVDRAVLLHMMVANAHAYCTGNVAAFAVGHAEGSALFELVCVSGHKVLQPSMVTFAATMACGVHSPNDPETYLKIYPRLKALLAQYQDADQMGQVTAVLQHACVAALSGQLRLAETLCAPLGAMMQGYSMTKTYWTHAWDGNFLPPVADMYVMSSLTPWGYVLAMNGRHDEACAVLQPLVARQTRRLERGMTVVQLCDLAAVCLALVAQRSGSCNDAEVLALVDLAARLWMRGYLLSNSKLSIGFISGMHVAALLFLERGDTARALAVVDEYERLSNLSPAVRDRHPFHGVCHYVRGRAAAQAGRTAEAAAAFARALCALPPEHYLRPACEAARRD